MIAKLSHALLKFDSDLIHFGYLPTHEITGGQHHTISLPLLPGKEQRSKGAKEQRSKGEKEQRSKGAKEQRRKGEKEQRSKGAKEQRRKGAKEQRSKTETK